MNWEKTPLDADDLGDDFPTELVRVQQNFGAGAAVAPQQTGTAFVPDMAVGAAIREGSKADTIAKSASRRLLSKLSS